MGYLNAVIQLDFPELAGLERPDDPDSRPVIWLTIRNPKLMPGENFMGKSTKVHRAADGSVTLDEGAADEAYGGFAKLVIAGNVLDPTDPMDENPPPLPMPPSPQDMAKYPIAVLNRLGEEVSKSSPR